VQFRVGVLGFGRHQQASNQNLSNNPAFRGAERSRASVNLIPSRQKRASALSYLWPLTD